MYINLSKAGNYGKKLQAKLLRVQDVDVVLSVLLAARQAITVVRETFHFVPRLGRALPKSVAWESSVRHL